MKYLLPTALAACLALLAIADDLPLGKKVGDVMRSVCAEHYPDDRNTCFGILKDNYQFQEVVNEVVAYRCTDYYKGNQRFSDIIESYFVVFATKSKKAFTWGRW